MDNKEVQARLVAIERAATSLVLLVRELRVDMAVDDVLDSPHEGD